MYMWAIRVQCMGVHMLVNSLLKSINTLLWKKPEPYFYTTRLKACNIFFCEANCYFGGIYGNLCFCQRVNDSNYTIYFLC